MNTQSSPLQGQTIVLLGGTGFFGKHLAQALLAKGARLRVLSRNPEKALALKPLANLGQLQLLRGDATRPESLQAALTDAQGVVNLVGAFTGDLDALQGQGAGKIAALAKSKGVSSYVQISAIGADAASPTAYGRTKAEGEAAVLAAFKGASILRPSLLFGQDDSFTNMFAGLISMLPALPVFGPEAQLQPLFVDDAAEAVAAALANPKKFGGKTFEIGGPEVITMLDLHQRIAAAQGRSPMLLPLPDLASSAFAALTGWLPGAPLSRDQWTLLQAGSVASANVPGMRELGITPRPLGLFLDRWMMRYRKNGRFGVKTAG